MWCDTTIVAAGSASELDKLEAFLSDTNGGFDFNLVIPAPEYDSLEELGFQECELYGGLGWSDWRRSHWSTKWNCEHVQRGRRETPDGACLTISFSNPWNAPIKVIDTLANKFPELDFAFCEAKEELNYIPHFVVWQVHLHTWHWYAKPEIEQDDFHDDEGYWDINYRKVDRYVAMRPMLQLALENIGCGRDEAIRLRNTVFTLENAP